MKRRVTAKPAPEALRSASYRRHILFAIFLLVTVLLAYSNSLHGTWAMDDILARRPVAMHDIHDIIGFRKVAYLSFLLNRDIAPFTPFNFRLFNVFIHFLNGLLIYALAYKTILLMYHGGRRSGPDVADTAGRPGDRAFWVALISSSIFVLHPLNIDAVAYIIQRMALLATLFTLLSLLSYIAAARSSGRAGKTFYYSLTTVFLLAGIFSKENAVMAVPLILLYDYIFLSRFDRKLFRKKMLIILAIALLSVGFAFFSLNLYAAADELVHMFINFNKPLHAKAWMANDVYWTPLEHVLTEFRVVSRYILLIFAPLPGFLVFDWWGYPVSKGLTEPPTTLIAVIFILSLLGFSIWKRKRLPLLSFGILWYFVAISLESFLALGSDLYFQFRNYLPLTGLIIGIVGQILISFRVKPKVLWGGAMTLCLVLGSLTYARNFVWKDSITLWTDTVQKAPSNIRAEMSLGNAYLKEADTVNAEKCYEKVVKMSSEGRRAHFLNDAEYSLGMMYLFRGQLSKAKELIDEFSGEIESYKPEILKAFYNSLTGKIDEAIGQYKEVLPKASKNMADTVVVYTLLGDAYRAKGMTEAAIANYKKALSFDPEFASAYYGMGVAYMARRNVQLAYEYFSKTLHIDPDNSLALSDMADLLLIRRSNPQDALAYAQRAVSKAPFFYRPYLTMGNVLTVLGRDGEAEGYYKQALAHGMPDYMLPFNKARAYYMKGDKEKAEYYVSQLRQYKDLPGNIQALLGPHR